MSKDLYDAGIKALTNRTVWEERQRVWYQMRHDGLRRRRKPFQGASDLHFPLIDTAIQKIKPFYYSQMFGNERMAQFVPLVAQMDAATQAAMDYFDFEVKQNTNLEDEVMHMIDTMLLTGRGILKMFWNPMDKSIGYTSINPIYFIVPQGAANEQDADFVIEVKNISVAEYKRNKLYTAQSPDFIKRITGQPTDQTNRYQQEKDIREGLTYSSDSERIIIWEAYEKTEGGYTVRTFCPMAPETDIRKPMGVPYKIKGKVFLPYVSFPAEVKDKGWYSPRGIAERLAPFEASLGKMWNEKHDCMTFYNKPLFKRTEELGNTGNIKFQPGEVLPRGVEPVGMPEPPMSFDQEMLSTREVAEQSIMLPDFGIGNGNKPNGAQGRERITATEVNAKVNLAQVGVDMNGTIFRRSTAAVFERTWALILQFKAKDAAVYTAEQLYVLPPQAAHDNYLVKPDGSPDQWSGQLRLQKATQRMQVLWGNPFVNQEELTRQYIQADDARLVKTLYQPGNQKSALEGEDEAIEFNSLLMNGDPAIVQPGEDHVTRLHSLLRELWKLDQVGMQLSPLQQQTIFGHIKEHLDALKQQNPQMAKQIEQMVIAMTDGGGPQQIPDQQPQEQPQEQVA